MKPVVRVWSGIVLSCLCSMIARSVHISIPLEIHHEGQAGVATFSFDSELSSTTAENEVFTFCHEFNIRRVFCTLLLQRVLDLLPSEEVQVEGLTRHPQVAKSIRLNEFKHKLENSTLIDELGNEVTEQVFSNLSESSIAELSRRDEEKSYSIIQSDLQSVFAREEVTRKHRFAVLHSCTLDSGDTSILNEMMEVMVKSGLIADLDMLWIVNHGHIINMETSTLELFSGGRRNVRIIQHSDDITRFEIPTLRMLHRLSRDIQIKTNGLHHTVISDPVDEILYLHTKGVSYRQFEKVTGTISSSAPQIDDWRNLLLHFLVTRHKDCHHLLQSKRFDALGVNFVSTPTFFNGNMWWSTASYLSSLPVLPISSSKAPAEFWVLHSDNVRVFILHQTNVNHYYERYPASLYQSISHPSRAAAGGGAGVGEGGGGVGRGEGGGGGGGGVDGLSSWIEEDAHAVDLESRPRILKTVHCEGMHVFNRA